MNITISPEVAALYRKQIEKARGVGIRISLKRSGCSGWKYQTEVATALKPGDDLVCESNDVTFYVPRKDERGIDGLVISLETKGLEQKVVFHHPDIVGSCGCGESVTLKEDKKS